MIDHLTIRGIDERMEAELKALARRRNLSVNKAALALLRKGAGLHEPGEGPAVIGSALDAFIGSWSDVEEKTFLEAVDDFNRIDDGMWA